MTSKEQGKETQDVIVRLLTNIGSRKEVEQYLRNYASVDAPKFAVVKASGESASSRPAARGKFRMNIS